ncbi:hypothetical protein Tsubulata_027887 [Turnera subulata]|uniref:Peroxidase n=1 Tax=Turnera subulata TaxID=218843 RepID=A0A9Q0JQZ5_9ROSI|nr:hypothetical protein Tsubulata_027887 [Turnera subulata]
MQNVESSYKVDAAEEGTEKGDVEGNNLHSKSEEEGLNRYKATTCNATPIVAETSSANESTSEELNDGEAGPEEFHENNEDEEVSYQANLEEAEIGGESEVDSDQFDGGEQGKVGQGVEDGEDGEAYVRWQIAQLILNKGIDISTIKKEEFSLSAAPSSPYPLPPSSTAPPSAANNKTTSGDDLEKLLSSTPFNSAECDADFNLSFPGDAFNLLTSAMTALELSCPSTTSCADILAAATRDLVTMVGGPYYGVLLGHKDYCVSKSSSVAGNLPTSTMSMSTIIDLFASRGFSVQKMVALSGAHTIG